MRAEGCENVTLDDQDLGFKLCHTGNSTLSPTKYVSQGITTVSIKTRNLGYKYAQHRNLKPTSYLSLTHWVKIFALYVFQSSSSAPKPTCQPKTQSVRNARSVCKYIVQTFNQKPNTDAPKTTRNLQHQPETQSKPNTDAPKTTRKLKHQPETQSKPHTDAPQNYQETKTSAGNSK